MLRRVLKVFWRVRRPFFTKRGPRYYCFESELVLDPLNGTFLQKLSTGVHVGPITINSPAVEHSKENQASALLSRLANRCFAGSPDSCSAGMVR